MSASGSKPAWLGEGLRLQRASWICSPAPSNFSHLEMTTAPTETSPPPPATGRQIHSCYLGSLDPFRQVRVLAFVV